jgi:hypothetical protein
MPGLTGLGIADVRDLSRFFLNLHKLTQMRLLSIILLVAVCAVSADYSSKDDVVELTASNFQKLVVSSSEPWVVEFYAPWCGHCKVWGRSTAVCACCRTH